MARNGTTREKLTLKGTHLRLPSFRKLAGKKKEKKCGFRRNILPICYKRPKRQDYQKQEKSKLLAQARIAQKQPSIEPPDTCPQQYIKLCDVPKYLIRGSCTQGIICVSSPLPPDNVIGRVRSKASLYAPQRQETSLAPTSITKQHNLSLHYSKQRGHPTPRHIFNHQTANPRAGRELGLPPHGHTAGRPSTLYTALACTTSGLV